MNTDLFVKASAGISPLVECGKTADRSSYSLEPTFYFYTTSILLRWSSATQILNFEVIADRRPPILVAYVRNSDYIATSVEYKSIPGFTGKQIRTS